MIFDESSFMDGEVDGESSTQYKVLPVENNPYTAVVKQGSLKPRFNVQGKKDPTKFYNWLDMQFTLILPPAVKDVMKRDDFDQRYSVGLELTPSGALDLSDGVNVDLGRLRKAVGQNNPGEKWAPRMLEGKMLKVYIKHRKEGENTYNEVDKLEAIQ